MNTENITLTLPASTVARMRDLVSSGDFPSIEYVVLCAFDRMQEPETEEASETELRESVQRFHQENESFEGMLTLEQMVAVLDDDLKQLREVA